MIGPGDPAPALTGTAVNGERIDLAAIRPRAAVLEFFRGTW